MSTVTDVLHNEVSHIGNLFGQMGSNPLKTAAQFALGAADPLSAKMWSGITGTHLTPLVGQLGGETNAQYAQSRAQGVNTGPSQMLGHIADAVALAAGTYGLASGGAGAAAGLGGGSAGGAGAGAADSGSVNLFADAVPGAGGDVGASVGASVGGAGTASTSGGSLLGNLSLAQKAELGMSALSLAKSAVAPTPNVGTATPVTQLPQGPESQGANPMTGTGQAGGAPGVAQTLLTGAGGIDPSTVGLGKNTLLGS